MLSSYVGGFSAALGSEPLTKTYATLTANAAAANKNLHVLWVGCGADDQFFSSNENFSKFLTTAGIQHVFHKSDGAHTWINWRRYLNEFAPLFF